MADSVLEVRDLHTHFYTKEGVLKAVNGVNFTLKHEEVLAIVGESGSGKTMTALSILRLVPYPGHIVSGEMYLNGSDIMKMDADRLRGIRGQDISMIFQDPITGLNPVIAIGTQVEELLQAHINMSKKEARLRGLDVLRSVGLPDPERIASQYPFQLSGGMCQRVMIGIAMALNPQVLIADEPTSALDVTVQAQILRQIKDMTRQQRTSVILITHDMGVVAQMADQVAVMYAGYIVEYGNVKDIFARPTHPYTWALMQALPRINEERGALHNIPGAPPNPLDLPDECPFIPRCLKARSVCRTSLMPALEHIEENHYVACYSPMVH
ncbi:MAG: ABC transporter ATP-binding protein [Dehalococcoidia bacterium]|nr:ABC transporter ATP-binding protein [Dehalococcoidia bacterium]